MFVREIEHITWERVGLFMFPAYIHQVIVEEGDEYAWNKALAWQRSVFTETTVVLYLRGGADVCSRDVGDMRTVVHQEKLHILTECDNIMLIESFV
jgi:hypothetical protein